MQTKKRVEDFVQARRSKKDILSMPICRSLHEMRKLDMIARNMVAAVKKDKHLDERDLQKNVEDFESEWFAEANYLVKELQMGANNLVMGIESMTKLKEELEKHTGKKHPMRETFHHEVKLANALLRGIHQKFDSIANILDRLK